MYLVCAFAAVLLSFAVDKVMMDHYIQLTEVAGPLTDQAYELKLICCTVHAVTHKYANVKYCTCTYNYQNNALTSRVTNIHVHAQTYINVLTNNSLKLTYFNFKFIFMILFN